MNTFIHEGRKWTDRDTNKYTKMTDT